MVSWGSPQGGGDASLVQNRLREVRSVVATHRAFCAVRVDGSVVTWGHAQCGGDSSEVQERLTDVEERCEACDRWMQQVYSSPLTYCI